jgi:hypothetical protein
MTTMTALDPRPTRSLYSGLILALIALALALQVSFLVGLATGRGGLGVRSPLGSGISERASETPSLATAPCVSL